MKAEKRRYQLDTNRRSDGECASNNSVNSFDCLRLYLVGMSRHERNCGQHGHSQVRGQAKVVGHGVDRTFCFRSKLRRSRSRKGSAVATSLLSCSGSESRARVRALALDED